MGEFVGLWAAFSIVVCKAVDFVRNLPYFKGKFIGSAIWNALAFVFGILLMVGWQHGIADDLFKQVPALQGVNLSDSTNYIISGLIVGGGAGFAHEVLDALSGIGSALQRRRSTVTEINTGNTAATATSK